ncbi:MAG TPA: dihydrolipoamide acetyltransferase family protein [Actinomycetota bacterium]|nr:dihydrolipoamide acetyltransferase family protein [Actinomycetota bacterium]
MATEIKMPQLGETVVEGTITRWLKQEGDTIEEDELLVEISTDKVDSEVPSSASGTIQKILVQEGDTVKVGTALAIVGDGAAEGGDSGGGDAAAPDQAETEAASSAGVPEGDAGASEEVGDRAEQVAEQRQQSGAAGDLGAEGGQGSGGTQERRESEKADASAVRKEGKKDLAPSSRPSTGGPSGKPGDSSKRGIISPLVRRLADEHDVNLDEIDGTGTGGRIRKQDVLRYVEEGKARREARPAAQAEPAPRQEEPARKDAPPPPPPRREEAPAAAASGGAREEVVPWSNIRRRTAEHRVAASHESARAWNAVEADWTRVVALRTKAKERFRQLEGFNLTYLPFLARAVCDTLLEMPEVNATFDEEQQANVLKRYVNLGIAVALDGGGLIVPVVKGADEKNLAGLARGINDVATRARNKKLTPDDLSGGTFTITNPGPFGSIMSVPIIPRGQTAILAFEAIQKRVVVTDEDAIAVRSMGFLPMSWDHRTIDGAEAAKFLARLRERIETTDFSQELSQYL